MKRFRKERGMTQAILAEKTGVAPNYIALIEAGKKFPSAAMFERIAKAFGISSALLFSQEDVPVSMLAMMKKSLCDELTTVFNKYIDNLSGKGQ
jgi:transcriptional regulator with XRE-family HTH domain